MWLLQLHFAVSILLFLTFVGIKTLFYGTIEANGWLEDGERISKDYLLFIIPIIQWMTIFMAIGMIFITKEQFDNERRKMDK